MVPKPLVGEIGCADFSAYFIIEEFCLSDNYGFGAYYRVWCLSQAVVSLAIRARFSYVGSPHDHMRLHFETNFLRNNIKNKKQKRPRTNNFDEDNPDGVVMPAMMILVHDVWEALVFGDKTDGGQ